MFVIAVGKRVKGSGDCRIADLVVLFIVICAECGVVCYIVYLGVAPLTRQLCCVALFSSSVVLRSPAPTA
jgi:hypothetical protein